MRVFPTPAIQLQAQETDSAQMDKLTLEQAIEIALQNNKRVDVAQSEIAIEKAGRYGAITIPRTEFSYSRGEFNTPTVKDNMYGVSQRINFPTVYLSQLRLAKAKVKSKEELMTIVENELISDVKSAYLRNAFLLENERLLKRQDSVFSNLVKSSTLRYRTWESTKL